METKQTTK